MKKTTTPPPNDSSDCISARELVRRHLNDENHEISEQELEKVALDCIDAPEEGETGAVPDATSIKMNAEQEEEYKDETEKDIAPTPLDVLS